MTVILADVLGYCMGVRRAVECAENAIKDSNGHKVYSLGPLIHNQITLTNLKENGLSVIEEEDLQSVEQESSVIIRAHGVPPSTIKKIENQNCTVINATCPRVTASQRNAEKYAKLGYKVILAGDKNHGEVTGIAGYAGSNFQLLENVEDAEKIERSSEKAVLLSQTTFSEEEFLKIAKILDSKFQELKVLNTICSATHERQTALKKLCPMVEGVVVVGGRNSANTQRLYKIAKENCENSILIETQEELPESFLKLNTVGITAGASTPDSVIQEVKERLLKG